jgi:hypothetical protein
MAVYSFSKRTPVRFLVFAVLGGLLAMHMLAAVVPGSSTAPATHGAHGAHAAHGAQQGSPPGEPDMMACHDGHGGHGGMPAHADAECAAAAVPDGPEVPVLTEAPFALPAVPAPSRTATGPLSGGRAPPDLAELQVLRI